MVIGGPASMRRAMRNSQDLPPAILTPRALLAPSGISSLTTRISNARCPSASMAMAPSTSSIRSIDEKASRAAPPPLLGTGDRPPQTVEGRLRIYENCAPTRESGMGDCRRKVDRATKPFDKDGATHSRRA